MKILTWLLILATLFTNCASKKRTWSSYESDNLKIKEISKDVFVHLSYLNTNEFGKVPCNGMIYFNQNEAIVFDTPTDSESSLELIHWIQNEQQKNIKAIVVTHFHEDCLGGLEEFHDRAVPSFSNDRTIKILGSQNQDLLPQKGFDTEEIIEIGGQKVYLSYFGEGHTKDNIVGYIPAQKALFGGCLIKSVKSGKGNLADATPSEWANTVRKIKNKWPDLKIVVPGHGSDGGIELLDYTIQMFEK